MTEENMTPELTLTPNLDTSAAAAAAAIDAAGAPSLTTDPSATAAAPQKDRDAVAVTLDESMLSEAERKMVDDFAKTIDLKDSAVILQYGAAAQKNIAAFSENTLNSVKTKDLGQIGETLSSLVVELKGFAKPQKKGIAGWFQKTRSELEAIKASYS